MKRVTGDTMTQGKYIKLLAMSYAKSGKSSFLVAQALGLMPWQRHGGIVTDPKHLHVIALDQDALDGIKDFLNMCGAPKEAHNYDVFDMREDYRSLADNPAQYNHTFFNTLMGIRMEIQNNIQPGETHAVIMSSFTTMAKAMERALMGKPTGSEKSGKGNGSYDLWGMLKLQMGDIQTSFQVDKAHMLWEAHLESITVKDESGKNIQQEALQVHGSSAKQWPNNTSHNFIIRRDRFTNHPGTEINNMYLEPKAGLAFISGGRNEIKLADREPDLTIVLKKLGYEVGRWNDRSKGKT